MTRLKIPNMNPIPKPVLSPKTSCRTLDVIYFLSHCTLNPLSEWVRVPELIPYQVVQYGARVSTKSDGLWNKILHEFPCQQFQLSMLRHTLSFPHRYWVYVYVCVQASACAHACEWIKRHRGEIERLQFVLWERNSQPASKPSLHHPPPSLSLSIPPHSLSNT